MNSGSGSDSHCLKLLRREISLRFLFIFKFDEGVFMKNVLLMMLVSFLLSACATQKSVVKQVVAEKEAVISFSSGTEIHAGDRVNLLKRACVQKVRGGRISGGEAYTVCRENFVGTAEVTKINSSLEAVISKIGEFNLEPGLVVKKME